MTDRSAKIVDDAVLSDTYVHFDVTEFAAHEKELLSVSVRRHLQTEIEPGAKSTDKCVELFAHLLDLPGSVIETGLMFMSDHRHDGRPIRISTPKSSKSLLELGLLKTSFGADDEENGPRTVRNIKLLAQVLAFLSEPHAFRQVAAHALIGLSLIPYLSRERKRWPKQMTDKEKKENEKPEEEKTTIEKRNETRRIEDITKNVIRRTGYTRWDELLTRLVSEGQNAEIASRIEMWTGPLGDEHEEITTDTIRDLDLPKNEGPLMWFLFGCVYGWITGMNIDEPKQLEIFPFQKRSPRGPRRRDRNK